MTSDNKKKMSFVKDQKGTGVLNEGEIKRSFQPQVRPQTQSSTPSVNPKTIPKKK